MYVVYTHYNYITLLTIKLIFLLQIVFEGKKTYRDEKGRTQTLPDSKKDRFVPKEERTLYIDGLVPKTVYMFNISAKYMDGTWGPEFPLRVETSIDG